MKDCVTLIAHFFSRIALHWCKRHVRLSMFHPGTDDVIMVVGAVLAVGDNGGGSNVGLLAVSTGLEMCTDMAIVSTIPR